MEEKKMTKSEKIFEKTFNSEIIDYLKYYSKKTD